MHQKLYYVCWSPGLPLTLHYNWWPLAAWYAYLHWLGYYIYIIELTVGFDTNINLNAERKKDKYMQLTRDLSSKYRSVNFINLSISSLGIFGKSCNSFIAMCNDLNIDKQNLNYALRKITAIIIRSTYYIFCMRNKPWTNPDLLTYWTVK